MLGSKYYVSNFVILIENMVVNINMDVMNVLGKIKNVVVVGMGKLEMEDYFEVVVVK